jgi:hypothetical protein
MLIPFVKRLLVGEVYCLTGRYITEKLEYRNTAFRDY